MSRRRQRARHRASRWTLLGRAIRRQVRAGARTAGRRRNEVAITILYALAGALCLALGVLLLVPPAAPPGIQAAAREPLAPGPALRAELIGGIMLGAVGLLLLGLAAARFWAWWQAGRRPGF